MAQSADHHTVWSAESFVPRTTSIQALTEAVQQCKGCPLWMSTTQAVFGEGPRTATVMLVGEQPGDQEDRQGHPFVGPAGRVLWECVEDAGVPRDAIYTTNAVKHFKHEDRGKRRIHKKPSHAEIEACHPWIDAELRAVRPATIVVLGATAARSIFHRPMPIAGSRGTRFEVGGVPTAVTYHPSAVLRAEDQAREIRAAIVDDLRMAHSWTAG